GVEGAETEYLEESPGSPPVRVSAYGGGFFSKVTSGYGMLFSAFWFNGPEEPVVPVPPLNKPLLQVGSAGTCFYMDEIPSGIEFLPGCPGGFDRGGSKTLKAFDEHRYVQWGQEVGLNTGTYGGGGYAIHTGILDPGSAGFWLDLAPPATPE
nr:hypothetical protein [Actinomycetota bacterium]